MTPALEPVACLSTAWQVTPDLPVRLIVASGLMAVAGWSDAQAFFPGKRAFFWLNTVLALWIAGTTAEHAAVDPVCKTSVALMTWPVILTLPALWALFLHQYVDSATAPPPRRIWLPNAVIGVGIAGAALSNGWHGGFYGAGTGLTAPVLGLPRMRYDYGPWFAAATVWGYAWLGYAAWKLLRAIQDATPEDRPRWLVFFAMMLIPWGTNAAAVFFGVRLFGGDPTPISFATALVGFGWLIRSSSLLRVVPMSRRLLFSALPDPVLVLDAHGRVIDCNAAGERLAGRVLPRGLPLADWPVFGPGLARVASRGDGTLVLDAPPAVFDVKVRQIGEGARRIGCLLQLRDVTERHRTETHLAGALAQRDAQLQQVALLEAELREQALRDPLTGLHNRRALAQRFAKECEHLAATGGTLGFALLDIDHFKRINDGFGHATGDAILQGLARLLAGGLRTSDAVFRIGGEEFALLLPHADAAQALQRVQALREQAAAALTLPDGTPLTFSAGIAACLPGEASLDAVMRAADEALYASKDGGRDRSTVWGDV